MRVREKKPAASDAATDTQASRIDPFAGIGDPWCTTTESHATSDKHAVQAFHTTGTWVPQVRLKRTLISVVCVFLISIPWYLAQQSEGLQPATSGKVIKVIDGDTIEVQRVGRVRFVGVNTPEKDEPGYEEAMEFLEKACLGKVVWIDIDDEKPKDHFGRILGAVYIEGTNLNALLLRSGHAEILYLPPSEFDPRDWLD